MALLSPFDFTSLINECNTIDINNSKSPKNDDKNAFDMFNILSSLKDCIKPRKQIKQTKFKSFTKRHVYWNITYYDNGDIVCSCPSYKYNNNKCKHIKKFGKNKS